MHNFNIDILISLITKLNLQIIIFSENVFTCFVAKRCLTFKKAERKVGGELGSCDSDVT